MSENLIGQRKHLRPIGAAKIRDPDNGGARFPDAGRVVKISEFWQRRINDGDVEVSDPPARAPKNPSPAAPPAQED